MKGTGENDLTPSERLQESRYRGALPITTGCPGAALARFAEERPPVERWTLAAAKATAQCGLWAEAGTWWPSTARFPHSASRSQVRGPQTRPGACASSVTTSD